MSYINYGLKHNKDALMHVPSKHQGVFASSACCLLSGMTGAIEDQFPGLVFTPNLANIYSYFVVEYRDKTFGGD